MAVLSSMLSTKRSPGTALAPRRRSVLLVLIGMLGWSAAGWPAVTTPEYQLKAVFLFNFTQFVDWPPQAFGDGNSPLVIGVLGTDPFGTYLDETVRGETINGRPLAVQRYTAVDQIKNCHVLFISRSEAARQAQILGSLKGKNILTVGETNSFNREGGIIRFATVANKIRLHIGLDAAKAANLTLSSKLLRPADVVDGED